MLFLTEHILTTVPLWALPIGLGPGPTVEYAPVLVPGLHEPQGFACGPVQVSVGAVGTTGWLGDYELVSHPWTLCPTDLRQVAPGPWPVGRSH